MRLQFAAVSVLFALSCAERIGPKPHLRARQDEAATTTAIDNAPSRTERETGRTPTPTDSASRTSDNEESRTTSNSLETGDVTSAITATPIETSLPIPTTNAILPDGSDRDPNVLPIQPTITPALGVAGALLMIAGLALGFVGIKHRPTQTFLSTSLLIALGIEVLIVYLMRPPVSNAVQGAYLIAGAVGGCALGALALIFKEVSEGFGCLLGGFCLAMWLLVLSPGGLIKNKVGKIILIGLFCAASFSLYISRFTRVYGIIVCTSFAGAYAFILGIDCFSKAGLKEFWLYIWDLNEDAFPLFTDTYPINRDMRAEIAAVIIIAFFGILSQIKIWKIVKEQKAKREADRLAEQEARDAEEEMVGRDVEAQVARERGAWEGTYEGKKMADVHVDSVTDSDKGSNIDDYDMSRPNTNEKRRSFPMLSLHPATRDGSEPRSLEHRQSSGSLSVLSRERKRASAAPSLPPLTFDFESGPAPKMESQVSLIPPAASPGLGISHAGSNASSTVDLPLQERRKVDVRRLSMASLSAHHAIQDAEDPFEAEEDDVASSIAATAAEAPDMDALSLRLSRPTSMYLSHSTGTTPMQVRESFIEDEDDEALCLPGKSPGAGSKGGSSPEIPPSPSGSYFSGAIDGGEHAKGDLVKERLPKKMSRAASTYRTNEWAKEVSRAEPVPVEEMEEHTRDAVQVETADAAAAARADKNNAAPAPPTPPPAPKPQPVAKPKPVATAYNVDRASKRLSRMPSGNAATPVYAHTLQDNEDSWNIPLAKRVSSNPALNSTYTIAEEGARDVTSPTLPEHQLISPPILKVSTPGPSRPLSRSQSKDRLSQMPRSMSSMSNLLDARQDRLDARLTTTSFMAPSAEVPPATASSSSDGTAKGDDSQGNPSSNTSISDAMHPIGEADEEDMTLAERKALVQRQSVLAQQNASLADRPLNRRTSTREEIHDPYRTSLISPAKQIRMSNPMYDSHQPRRTSSHNVSKQAMNWNQWRDSTAQVGQQRDPILTSDSQMDMLRAARMQSESEKKMRDEQKKHMQEQMDQHMRMGGMHDAHRAALARMQSKVKD
ncbi:hypothetical protein Slin15195_G051130 [Septoria linicola]|uniref:TM7S3/TM198-like domain-containing protein n=1 Tax=Septoria linicola TaxID=215465 RepID=A0A9Q9EJ40_9PEZI|nr:hypothetical protein Slin15195_G051130 [Septoria linicola]